ncbi:thioesterase family protein [Penicillium brasilianum]|uniref:Thioesterase family protein n=1 Tax=Penicillium brasilianum TaxID=104259 RepID=A0A1S9RBK5_PENBI|nr:thioesterase family protein [Penicillium brasilianum]
MHSRRILRLPLRAHAPRVHVTPRFRLAPKVCLRDISNAATSQNTSAQPSRWTRRLIYATIFGTLGISVGKWMDNKVAAPPLPGTPEDKMQLQDIQHVFDTGLPIVQRLRGNPDFVEMGVYENYSEESKTHRLTSGALGGSKGFGLQRAFWNEKEHRLISVVFMGSGIEGWPTMVHGGALGTIIDENLGRAAVRHFPARTGMTANLNINYRAPVYSDNFYSIHSTLDPEQSTDRKAYVRCEVRDMTGRVCVEANGLFVVPKKLKLVRLGDTF